ncbi:hypothetical protein RND71_031938 [Anisodus tanguticus]|uniref:BED-type domain-containing protein n=1 Tax=Anisodus tanguticus TaxID=243964 RepID=A0AAE1RCR7_9SOLA|nr:hypothetical protein RND71_031938 [Anisodus tanguticus]
MRKKDAPSSSSSKQKKPPLHPTVSGSSSHSQRVRKKKSKWWVHYEDTSDPDVARCSHCDVLIGFKGTNGTTPLRNHAQRCKKCPANLDLKQKLIDFELKTITKEDGSTEIVNVPKLRDFDQEFTRKALARMIIVDELPFMFVEREGFRYFCKAINPAFVMPSRATVTRDCYKLFIEERKKLQDCFRGLSSRICLTTDTWTSGQNLSYMCLITHFIDENWKLHKKIINFCPIASHSGEIIGRPVGKCLNEWRIKRILTVTMDNASSHDLPIQYFKRRMNHHQTSVLNGDYLHMRCVAHILNLVVRDGLKDLDSSIVKIRGSVRYVRYSPARLQKFKACAHE